MTNEHDLKLTILTVGLNEISKTLGGLAKAAEAVASQLDRLSVMIPGQWPDRFTILSRRMRYGMCEDGGFLG